MYKFTILLVLCLLYHPYALAITQKSSMIVTLKPIYLLAQDIVGDTLNVESINNIDSHHDLLLKPSDIKKIKKADIIFYEGFSMAKILKPYYNAIDLSEDAELLLDRNNRGYDTHFWLNPNNAIIMSEKIAGELIARFPDNTEIYSKNLEHLIVKIKSSSNKINNMFDNLREKKYIVIHDAYRYFEKYFNLSSPLGSFYSERHDGSSFTEIQKIFSAIERNEVQCVVSDSKHGKRLLKNLNKTIKFTVIDPVGNNYKHQSYPELLEFIAERFASCMS